MSDSSEFNYYRLAVVNAWDPAAEVKRLKEQHLLAGSDVVLLDVPDGAHVWGWTLLRNAGRVFDVEGKQVDIQNPEVRWTLEQSKRWMGPARELTELLKVSMPSGRFSEVICFSNDAAESTDCSSFVTAELGKQSSELITGLASGSPQDAVKAASAKGRLDHVVVLALDMPVEGAMLPWERTFFKNVARVYGVTKSGGLKVLTPR